MFLVVFQVVRSIICYFNRSRTLSIVFGEFFGKAFAQFTGRELTSKQNRYSLQLYTSVVMTCCATRTTTSAKNKIACTPLKVPIEINRFRSSFTYNDVRARSLNYVYKYIVVYLKEWILLFSGRKSKPNGVSYTIFVRTEIHKETIFPDDRKNGKFGITVSPAISCWNVRAFPGYLCAAHWCMRHYMVYIMCIRIDWTIYAKTTTSKSSVPPSLLYGYRLYPYCVTIFERLQWKKKLSKNFIFYMWVTNHNLVMDYTKWNVYGIDTITIISMTQLTTESNLITETHLVMTIITINRYAMSYMMKVFFFKLKIIYTAQRQFCALVSLRPADTF